MKHPSSAFVIGGTAAAALVTIFFVVFVALANHTGSTHSITITGTATATVTTNPSPTITPSPLPNIWQPASVNYGKAIAFAPGDSQTGYVCGNPGNTTSTLQLGVTHDGGMTWVTHSISGITGASCSIAINPYDANEIVLASLDCWYGCGEGSSVSYRSFDGGKTWSSLVMSPGNEGSGWTELATPIWTPTALFFGVATGSSLNFTQLPPHPIAVSVNRGPLTWTQRNPISQANFGITAIFTLGNSINAYATTAHINGNAPQGDLATSNDNGATWTQVTPKGVVSGPEVIVPDSFRSVSDGHELIGFVFGASYYLRSTDGGKTWDLLPTLQGPANSTAGADTQVTPDGSIYGVVGDTKTGIFIFRLAPGGTAWTSVVSLANDATENQSFTAVSWDANGHPKLIWSATVKGGPPNYQPVLEYHPA